MKVIKNLLQIVDKQILKIQKLKNLVKKANKTATEAILIPVRESSTIASHLVAVMAASPQPKNILLSAASHQAQAKPAQSKKRPKLVINLSNYNVSIKKRMFLSLRKYLKLSLQSFDKTQNMVLKSMNKNKKRKHRFFPFLIPIKIKKRLKYMQETGYLQHSRKEIFSC